MEAAGIHHHIGEREHATRMTASNGHYTLPTPTRFDHTFMGWADKNGKTFTTDNILSSDTTLTAQWKQMEFNITSR